MFCIYSTLEAELFPALRVFDGDVVFSGPVDFQTGLGQGLEHARPVFDLPLLKTRLEIGMHGILGLGPVILAGRFAPAEQAGIMQVGLFRRMQSGAGRVVRSGPALPVVVKVAEHIKVFLPAGRTGIKRLAAGKLHARNNKVQFVMIGVYVPHPENIALVRLQSGKGHALKVVHHPLFLFRRHRVVRVPGEHPGGELPLVVQGIYQGAGLLRVAAQDFRRALVASGVVRAHKVAGRSPSRALAVREDFHVHDASSQSGRSDGGGVSRNSRSRLTRAASTSMASARLL